MGQMWTFNPFQNEIQIRQCAWMRRCTSTRSTGTLARRSCFAAKMELSDSTDYIANSAGSRLDTDPILQQRLASSLTSTTMLWSPHMVVPLPSTRSEVWLDRWRSSGEQRLCAHGTVSVVA